MTWFLWHHVRAVGLALLLLAVHCAQVVAYSPLSDESLRNLPSAGEDFDIKTGKLLAPILIPRVPGTDGSKKVQHHFVDFFTEHLPQWNIEYQNSTSKTPATGESDVPFVNLIFSRDPPWAQSGNVGRLTLVAHYDSKLSPAGFIGATDSAAPCAMLLHAARSIDEALTRKWDAMELEGSNDGLGADRGVQILFLDGEEAFVSWSDSDSLYGARSLAETWEHTSNQPLSIFKSRLSEIDLFVLLDLLGAPNPTVPSYFQTTHWAYQNLAKIEARLRDLTLLQSKPKHPFLPESQKTTIFQSGVMQDDHIPFIRRGIEILHLIAAPFPRVWHTMDDDGEHLDLGTVHDWAQIITAFAAEWMELEGYFPDAAQSAQQEKTKRRTEL